MKYQYKFNFSRLLFLLVFWLVIFLPEVTFANDADIDTTFNQGDSFDNGVHTLLLELDGQIIIGGSFSSYNNVDHQGIVRVDKYGTIDTNFNHGKGIDICLDDEGINNCSVNTLSLQADSKIIVAGTFNSYDGIPSGNIVRLNKDGTLDDTFMSGTGANNSIYSSLTTPDGQIIIGGNFTTYNGKPYKKLIRLNNDGSIDTSFNISMNDSGTIYAMDMQSDGKIIIAGWFNKINGQSVRNIARLNYNGSLDDSFNHDYGSNGVIKDVVIDKEGKILVVGHFTFYNNLPFHYIVRLNRDGSVDKNFNTLLGTNNTIHTVSVQNDGKIIIGGSFKSFNNISRNRIARLKTDGSLDVSFEPIIGADDNVFTSLIQPDGKIILGGWFTSYNGFLVNYLTRLIGSL